MSFKKQILFLLAVTVISFVFFQSFFKHSPPEALAQKTNEGGTTTPPTLPNVIALSPSENQALNATLTFNATAEPYLTAALFARTDGFLKERYVDIGHHVKKDDILAVLTAPEIESEIHAAKAIAQQRRAELALASQSLKRAEPLLASGAVSKQFIDEKRAEYNVAEAHVKAAEAEISRLQNIESYLTIRAPFDGVITEKYLDQGARVSANDTNPLFRISQIDKLKIIVDIPQTQVFRINDTENAFFSLREKPKNLFNAQFIRKGYSINELTGNLRYEFQIENTQFDLPAGVSGTLDIPTSSQNQKIITLPTNAIIYKDGETMVAVVNQTDQPEATVSLKNISLGSIRDNQVEILSGISKDDKVITNPQPTLKSGDKVNVTFAEQK